MKKKSISASDDDSNQPDDSGTVSPLISDQILIEHLPLFDYQNALLVSAGRAQLATRLLGDRPAAHVIAWYIDLHQADRARVGLPENVQVVCAAELPEGPVELAALAISKRGEAELTRDLLQQAHERLVIGGTLAASVDNPKDSWLHEQLETMFDKITTIDAPSGRLYVARKTKPLRRLRNFQAEIVFRDEDHLIKLLTRPGVFAHRQLDPGARQLLLSADIEPGQRVLDLGCGSGALAVASAMRTKEVEAFAVDSNARAIACVQATAQLNNVSNVKTILNWDGQLGLDASIDIVLCNPPYYSDFEIAERMVRTAGRALRPGGAALFVNKQPRWYDERLPQSFVDVEIFESGKYFVACGRRG